MLSLVLGITGNFFGRLNLQSIMAALVSAAICFLLFTTWNQLFDNPAIKKTARADYVRIAKFEGMKAQRDTANRLLALQADQTIKISKQLDGYREAGRVLEISRSKGRSQEQALEEELDALETSNKDGVPLVGDVGVLKFLRNR